jgi:hypothetical protein
MAYLRVNDILKERILISRESAHLLERALRDVLKNAGTASTGGPTEMTIDFDGIEGVSPSFVDELLLIFESLLEEKPGASGRSLFVAHAPTRLSSKFEAVARGHGLCVKALQNGSWAFTSL